MIKNKTLAIFKIVGIISLTVFLLLAVVPLVMPINPVEGTLPAKESASEDSKFVTIPFKGTDGIDIHYLSNEFNAEGEKPTFVLIHGSMFNLYTWDKVMDTFSQYGNVVAYDQIPYGLSEKMTAGEWNEANPYTPDAAISQLFTFLNLLEIDEVVLVGHSYGGTLAVRAALSHPDRVESLILVDPAVYVQEEMPAWLMELPQVRRIGPLLARALGNSKSFIRSTYLNPEKISVERIEKTMTHTKVDNWDESLWEYLRVWGQGSDYTSEIPKIQQNTLIISGDSDKIVPLSDSQKLNSELPNSELIVIPSCGHVPQEECTEKFEEVVNNWLKQQL